MEFLKRHIKKIEEMNSRFKKEIKEIKEIEPDTFNIFHHWTPLKLTFLNFTLDVCAIVADKKYAHKNFIDLFAGSGLNKTKDKHGDVMIGSPFIALLNQYKKFTSFFFCEENPEFFGALKKRINALNIDNCNLYPSGCDYNLDEILKKISEDNKPYNFFFIDPYKLEFIWNSMKKILNIRSDVLLTFMSLACWRAVCANRVTGNEHKALTDFFGDDSWKEANCEEDIVEIYKKNILKERPDAVILNTKIKSSTNFSYQMIFITHKTSGGNPWLDAIREAKKEIESHSDLAVKMVLDIIKNRQTELLQFEKRKV